MTATENDGIAAAKRVARLSGAGFNNENDGAASFNLEGNKLAALVVES